MLDTASINLNPCPLLSDCMKLTCTADLCWYGVPLTLPSLLLARVSLLMGS